MAPASAGPNIQFRDARRRSGLTRAELADKANQHLDRAFAVDENQIGKIERGLVSWPRAPRRAAFREVLGAATDTELGFVDTKAIFRESASDLQLRHSVGPGPAAELKRQPDQAGEGDPVRRRTFTTIPFVVAAAALSERTQYEMYGALDDAPLDRSVDEWLAVSEVHGRRCMLDPPGDMRVLLTGELLLVRRELPRHDSPELRGVVARLATLYAMTLASLGELKAAPYWYGAAKKAAAASGNRDLLAWIHGREILRSDYDGYATPDEILTFVHDSGELAETPSVARMEIMVAAARALARIGEHRRARAAFDQARLAYDAIPHLTTNAESMYYLPEWRFQLRGAFISAMAGDTVAVDRTMDAIAADRGGHLLRWSVQVDLNRALAAARAGDDATAEALAVPTVERTPRTQQTQTMRELVRAIANSMQYGPHRDTAIHLRGLVGIS